MHAAQGACGATYKFSLRLAVETKRRESVNDWRRCFNVGVNWKPTGQEPGSGEALQRKWSFRPCKRGRSWKPT